MPTVASETPAPNIAYRLHAAELIAALRTDERRGLSDEEAFARYGPNELAAPRPVSAWRRSLSQFQDVFVILLLIATGISAALWVLERDTAPPQRRGSGEAAVPQWLLMEQAMHHCTAGIGIWDWASNDQGDEPDVVMACCGDVPTLESRNISKFLKHGGKNSNKIAVVAPTGFSRLRPLEIRGLLKAA
jgi:hypothetical protein